MKVGIVYLSVSQSMVFRSITIIHRFSSMYLLLYCHCLHSNRNILLGCDVHLFLCKNATTCYWQAYWYNYLFHSKAQMCGICCRFQFLHFCQAILTTYRKNPVPYSSSLEFLIAVGFTSSHASFRINLDTYVYPWTGGWGNKACRR